MRIFLSLGVAIGTLFMSGCDKPNPASQPKVDAELLDLGLIELVAESPKEFEVDGRNFEFTATPQSDGQIHLVVETDNSGLQRTTMEFAVPADVECSCYIGNKPVRFTLKVKPS